MANRNVWADAALGRKAFIICIVCAIVWPNQMPFSALGVAAAGDSSIAQFGTSIYLGGPWDWEPENGGPSRCEQMIDQVAKDDAIKKVQFVPTLYWWDSGPREPLPAGFDPTCKNADLSSYYCYSRFNSTTVEHWCYTRLDGQCPEVTQQELDSFKNNVGKCMKYAADKGLDLAVNARVDDGRSLGGWRNTLDFDPTKKYGKYSYEEAVLIPLADMLADAAAPGTEIAFTPQGEMGATVFFYPKEWKELIGSLRSRIQSRRNGGGVVQIGLGTNNLKSCGCKFVGIVDAYEYLTALENDFDPAYYDLPAIQDTYNSADYVGISAYIPMPKPDFEVCQLEGLLERMDREMSLYGMSLLGLTDAGLEIHYAEYGMGGGTGQNGDQPAKTAEEAAYTPFFGIGGSYTCDKDPFDMCNPDKPNPVRDYRRYYYNQSSQYFKQDGCNYHGVQVAYIWGTGSWDVLAVYPGDRSSEGSWSDPVVVQTIKEHNKLAQGGAGNVTAAAGNGTPLN